MTRFIKTAKYGLSFLLILLAGVFCSVPAFAEESSNERIEQVEETVVILAEKKQKEVSLETSVRTFYDNVPLTYPNSVSKGFQPFDKLYILYGSIRLCD